MYQLQYPLLGMPISLVLLSNGHIVWIKTNTFLTIYDMPPTSDSVAAIFTEEGFTLGEEEFNYNIVYDYKNIPSMLKWLKDQNLPHPSDILGV